VFSMISYLLFSYHVNVSRLRGGLKRNTLKSVMLQTDDFTVKLSPNI